MSPLRLSLAISAILASSLALATAAAAQGAAPAGSKPAERAPETDEQAIELANRIEKLVEKTRGLKFKREVKKGVYDKERLARFLAEQMKKEKVEDQYAWQEPAWKLLGLVPESFDVQKEMTELLLEQIGGFYDPDTKELRVMRGFGGLVGEILMAHELCHALEDQHFDLKAIDDANKKADPDDEDRTFAAHAVMEGSATDLMNRFALKRMQEGGMSQQDLLGSIDLTNPAFSGEKARKAPPILVRPLLEMYLSGASFLARGAMMGARKSDVRRAFLSPPLSSEQVLHPEKYWDPKTLDVPRTVALPNLAETLGKGWDRLGSNVLGELGVAILTAEKAPEPDPNEKPNPLAEAMKMLTAEKTTALSRGWDGDRYDLYGGPGGARLLAWVSVWDTEDDAKEVELWLRGYYAALAKGRTISYHVARETEKGAPAVVLLVQSAGPWAANPDQTLVNRLFDGLGLGEAAPLKRSLAEEPSEPEDAGKGEKKGGGEK